MSWIATYTGRRFDLLDPQPDQIHVDDIAVALSRIPRFAGHSRYVISVAEHSLRVSLRCSPPAALYGLMHDASEAYLGDITRPLKLLMPEYQAIETNVMMAILKKFSVDASAAIVDEVHEIDGKMLETERRDFFPQSPDWGGSYGVPYDDVSLVVCSPIEAECLFRKRFYELTS